MSFVFIGEEFNIAPLALRMKIFEKQDVKVFLTNPKFETTLQGIIDKEADYVQFLGKKNIFIMEDSHGGEKADALRVKGESVWGGGVISDKMEESRTFGQ